MAATPMRLEAKAHLRKRVYLDLELGEDLNLNLRLNFCKITIGPRPKSILRTTPDIRTQQDFKLEPNR